MRYIVVWGLMCKVSICSLDGMYMFCSSRPVLDNKWELPTTVFLLVHFSFCGGRVGTIRVKQVWLLRFLHLLDTLLFLRNYLDQQYKVFTIHLEIKLLWCSLMVFQVLDHFSRATYKSCILHSAAIGLVWQRFPRLCSDLWIVCDGLCSLLFLALDPYKVKELCHHHHHHHRHYCHHHHHHDHHYCSYCTEAMKTSPMHCMNNGMQGFLLSGTCCIALHLPLEYTRQYKVLAAGTVYHMVITVNIFVNRMKWWWGPKHCSHMGSIYALYWAGSGLKSRPGDQLQPEFFVFLLCITWEIPAWFFNVFHSQFLVHIFQLIH